MAAARLQPTLGGFVTCVAWLMVTTAKVGAAASWGGWEQQPVPQQQGIGGEDWLQRPSGRLQDPNYAFDQALYQDLTIPVRGASFPVASSYTPARPKPVFDVVPPQQLSLADLPVDAETADNVSQSKAADKGTKARRKHKNSLAQVLVNFFKKPSLVKVLVLVVVMVASFFLMGIAARIAQFVFALWLSLTVLRHFEEASQMT